MYLVIAFTLDIPLYCMYCKLVNNHNCYTDKLHGYMFRPLSGHPQAIKIHKIKITITITITIKTKIKINGIELNKLLTS